MPWDPTNSGLSNALPGVTQQPSAVQNPGFDTGLAFPAAPSSPRSSSGNGVVVSAYSQALAGLGATPAPRATKPTPRGGFVTSLHDFLRRAPSTADPSTLLPSDADIWSDDDGNRFVRLRGSNRVAAKPKTGGNWIIPYEDDAYGTPLYEDAIRFGGYRQANRWTYTDDDTGELRTSVIFNNGLAASYGPASKGGKRLEVYKPLSANPTLHEVANSRAVKQKYAQEDVNRRTTSTARAPILTKPPANLRSPSNPNGIQTFGPVEPGLRDPPAPPPPGDTAIDQWANTRVPYDGFGGWVNNLTRAGVGTWLQMGGIPTVVDQIAGFDHKLRNQPPSSESPGSAVMHEIGNQVLGPIIPFLNARDASLMSTPLAYSTQQPDPINAYKAAYRNDPAGTLVNTAVTAASLAFGGKGVHGEPVAGRPMTIAEATSYKPTGEAIVRTVQPNKPSPQVEPNYTPRLGKNGKPVAKTLRTKAPPDLSGAHGNSTNPPPNQPYVNPGASAKAGAFDVYGAYDPFGHKASGAAPPEFNP